MKFHHWLLSILLFSGIWLAAQEEEEIVREIEFRGLLTVGEDFLKAKLELQEGKLFSSLALRKAREENNLPS